MSMLVLSRKKGERIVIAGNIVITVLDIRGGEKCRLGVEAPREISVDRQEVFEEKRRENPRPAA